MNDVSFNKIECKIELPALSLDISLRCGLHSELSAIEKNKEKHSFRLSEPDQNLFPFLKTLINNNIKDISISSGHLATIFLSQSLNLEILEEMIDKQLLTNARLQRMLYAIIAEYSKNDKLTYIDLLYRCINYDLFSNSSLSVAEKGIKDADTNIRTYSLYLLKEIIKKANVSPLSLKIALESACLGLTYSDENIYDISLSLLYMLISKDSPSEKSLSVALDAGNKAITSDNEDIREKGLDLFAIFHKKKLYPNEVKIAAEALKNDENSSIQNLATRLLSEAS